MLKKIREEKTYQSGNIKEGVQEALLMIDGIQEKKNDHEEEWVEELIQRKQVEVDNMP